MSRSGYYGAIRRNGAAFDREAQDRTDFELIRAAYRFRGYDKGVMGIHMRLLREGVRMNHKKIRRLMRKYGLYCPIRKPNPYRRMAKAMRTNAVADNSLERKFREHGPRKVFLTDITYIPFEKKFCYLSVIKDAYTKQVLSYVLSMSLEVELVLETVRKLFRDHDIPADARAMIHSDQGCHYTSVPFRELIGGYGLAIIGYEAGMTITPELIRGFMFIIGAIPAILCVLAAVILGLGYKITDADAIKYATANAEKDKAAREAAEAAAEQE